MRFLFKFILHQVCGLYKQKLMFYAFQNIAIILFILQALKNTQKEKISIVYFYAVKM